MAWTERDFQHGGLYRVEIEGIDVGYFEEVTIPETEVKVVEYYHGQSKRAQKRPGEVKYGNLKLKRGYNNSRVLAEWIENCAKGQMDRRSVSVTLDNEDSDGNGAGEIMRWNFFDCWVTKWSISSLKGSSNEITSEEIEIVTEYYERAS